jgi:SPP1 gp7 family putative phage head morphogenesis protein
MNTEHWKSIRRNVLQYERELDSFVRRWLPWDILGTLNPELIIERRIAENELFRGAAELLARRMITGVAVTNAHSWRVAASRSLGGKEIYAALQHELRGSMSTRVNEIVQANAQRIMALPDEIARRTARFIATEQRRGTRAASILAAVQRRLPELADSRAKMLARTSVGAAETALTRARSERIGLNFYQWATSEDSRVRPSHRLMDKVLVSWVDPANPEKLAGEGSPFGSYAPAQVPNCRCIALPLVDLNEIRWPAKVYAHGQISPVSRAQFEQWNKLPSVA